MQRIHCHIRNRVVCDGEGLRAGQLDGRTISNCAPGFAGDVRNGVVIDGNNGIIARLNIDTALTAGNLVAADLEACHIALRKDRITAGFVSGKCAVLDGYIAISGRVRHSEARFKCAVFEGQSGSQDCCRF